MSPAMVCIRFPQCCANSSRRSARRAVAMTWAPAACSTRANRPPSPAEAPVTSATRPSSRHRLSVPAPGTADSVSFIVPPHEPAARARCSARDDLGRAYGLLGGELRTLDGGIRGAPPLGPGAVVDPDPVTADQVGEHKPGGGRAPADGAVGDQLPAALQDGRREHAAQLRCGAERPVFVVEAVDGLVDGRRHVPGAATWFHAARWPEALAPVLSR